MPLLSVFLKVSDTANDFEPSACPVKWISIFIEVITSRTFARGLYLKGEMTRFASKVPLTLPADLIVTVSDGMKSREE